MSPARDYLSNPYPRRATSALIWLVATIIAAFVLQLIVQSPWFGSGAELVRQLALTIPGLQHGHFWTLLTHSLLHDTGSFHVLFTLLGLVFLGRELEPVLGSKRFLGVYSAGILLGGLAWTAVNWRHGGGHLGAGAGVTALLVVLAGVHPQMELNVFFLPPVVRIKHLVYVLLGVDLLGLLFYELIGAPVPLGLSPSAHLGGMLAGGLYFRFLHARHGWDRDASLTLPGWLQSRSSNLPAPPTPAGSQLRSAADLRADVDRILDKINSHGFGSLSDAEKQTLDEARDLLSRN